MGQPVLSVFEGQGAKSKTVLWTSELRKLRKSPDLIFHLYIINRVEFSISKTNKGPLQMTNNPGWKPSRRYPPKATLEISVASTFTLLEWMVDIMPMNETDTKSNDEHINILTLFNPVSKGLIASAMKSKMTKELVHKVACMLESCKWISC
jgi:hypothetical protein